MKTILQIEKRSTMKTLMNLILITVMLLSITVSAQPEQGTPGKPGKSDRIEALRIAFISERLNLTPGEAQNFWPVYNQYRNDLETIHKNCKPGEGGQLTAEQQIDLDQKKLDLKKRFKPQFEGALGKDKMNRLYNLEGEFHQKLKDMRDQRQGQGPKGSGPQGHGPNPNGPRPGGPQGGGMGGGPRPGGR